MLAESQRGCARGITVGADKAYDSKDFVRIVRELNVTPHITKIEKNRGNNLDRRTTWQPGYAISLSRLLTMAKITQFRLLAIALLVQPRIGIGCGLMRIDAPLLSKKVRTIVIVGAVAAPSLKMCGYMPKRARLMGITRSCFGADSPNSQGRTVTAPQLKQQLAEAGFERDVRTIERQLGMLSSTTVL